MEWIWSVLFGRLKDGDWWPSVTKIGGWAAAFAAWAVLKAGPLLNGLDPEGAFVNVDTVSAVAFMAIGLLVAGARNAVEKYAPGENA